MSSKTVLIGLDGATFTVLDPLMRDRTMPFLADLAASGVSAALHTVVPALTPPAWTSLMTGRGPGSHGIFDFFRKESAQSAHIRMLMARDIACETIWAMASRQGKRTTVLNFPMTYPPIPLDGCIVPGWMPWRQIKLGCYPAGLYDRLKALPGFDPRELAMDMEIEEKAIEGCEASEFESWIDAHIRREQQWTRIVCHLMENDPCELTAVLFDGVDKLQHLFWRFIDSNCLGETPSDWELFIRGRCLEYFQRLDAQIREIVHRAGPEATIVVASDHGFGAQRATFFVNAWLAQQGYLAWVDKAPQPSKTSILGLGQLTRHAYQLDWTRTLAYAATPSSNGIHIVMASESNPHGVPPQEYDSFRERLEEQLLGVIDPVTGQSLVSRIWKREEVFEGPFIDLAPDLTLVLCDGGLISILDSETPVLPRREPHGTHRPEGVFMARGPRFKQGIQVDPLSILDIAPLILYSLDLPIPPQLEGRLPTEVLTADALQGNPVVFLQGPGADFSSVTPWNDQMELNPKDLEKIGNQLRALGYIE